MPTKNKTVETRASVEGFLDKLPEDRRQDCLEIHRILKSVIRAEAAMWGPGIVGYGKRRLKYESGRELDWFYAGFAPRKDHITLYILSDPRAHAVTLKRLGKHKVSGGCLHIKRLAEVDTGVLEELVRASFKEQQRT